jgi:hypothetical protein
MARHHPDPVAPSKYWLWSLKSLRFPPPRLMKCFHHTGTDAVAVCASCGHGVCAQCIQSPPGSRVACSAGCAKELARRDETLVQISTAAHELLQQSHRNARASAVYCYLGAGLSAAGSIVAWFMLPSPFLILFTAGCAVVLLLSGIWYGLAARHKSL